MSAAILSTGKIVLQVFLPYHSLYEPINNILNAIPEERQEKLILKWKDAALYELNFIGIVAALLASVVTSSLAWPLSSPLPWAVQALYLTALLFSFISISLAAQQAIALTKVSNSEFATHRIRLLLGSPTTSDHPTVSSSPPKPLKTDVEDQNDHSNVPGAGSQPKWKPSKLQLYVWQIPSLLLGNAILIFVLGLAIWVFVTARDAVGWGDEKKIGVFFGCFMAFAMANYVLSWSRIEKKVQAY